MSAKGKDKEWRRKCDKMLKGREKKCTNYNCGENSHLLVSFLPMLTKQTQPITGQSISCQTAKPTSCYC